MLKQRPKFHPVHDDYYAVVIEDGTWLEYASTDQFWELFEWANEAEIDLEALESDYNKQTETLNGICQHNLKLMQELQYYKDREGFCEDCYAEHISNIKVGTDEEAK